jgi:ribonuclease P protein subunit POP4
MSSTSAGHNPVQDLLARAHSPDSASRIFSDKIQHRPLLLRPSSPPPKDARDARQKIREAKQEARRRSTKNKVRPLSAKEKRKLCVYEIPQSHRKYAIYEPLHKMWIGYVHEILGLGKEVKRGGSTTEKSMSVTPQATGQMLVSADYHGAEVEVIRSRSVSRVGVRGIVVKDTKHSFEVITTTNELKILPKEHTDFRFEVPLPEDVDLEQDHQKRPLVFEVHGSRFEMAAPSRAKRAFKPHFDPDL